MRKSATLIVRVTSEMKQAVEQLAAANRRTVPDYMRLVFEQAIKRKLKF